MNESIDGDEDTLGLDNCRADGENHRRIYDEETEHDRCIRKCTMINLIILFLCFSIYKAFVLITFGYYTFR